MAHRWLQWVQRLQAIAQSGLTYQNHPYDVERYEQLQQITAEIMAAHTDLDVAAVLELFQREKGYATPKVDVRGAVFQDDRILLVRQRADGLWTLPGGWVDVGEPPSQAVEREILEESGFRTKAMKLAAVYDRDHPRHGHLPEIFHVYKLFFLCEMLGGEPAESYEIQQVGFFREDALPKLSLVRVVPSQIARLFEYHRHPDLPTDFD